MRKDKVIIKENRNYITKTITIRPDEDDAVFTYDQIREYCNKKLKIERKSGTKIVIRGLNILRDTTLKGFDEDEIMEDDQSALEDYIRRLQSIEIVTSASNKEYINRIYDQLPKEVTGFQFVTDSVNPDFDVGVSHQQTLARIKSTHYSIRANLQEYNAHKEYSIFCSYIQYSQYERLIEDGIFTQNLFYSINKKLDYIYDAKKELPNTQRGRRTEYFSTLFHNFTLRVYMVHLPSSNIIFRVGNSIWNIWNYDSARRVFAC